MIATLQTPYSRASLHGESLLVTYPTGDSSESQEKQNLPLGDLERLILGENTSITTPALCELLRRKIPVSFLTYHGKFLGSFEPPTPSHASTRHVQYQRQADGPFSLAIARALLLAKIQNQRRLLQRVDSNHHRLHPVDLEQLACLLRDAEHCQHLDQLRGFEGLAAAQHYAAWSRFLPEAFPFERRSTRPPHNPVNAVLSYLSTLVYGELLTACHTRGLDPGLSHLHSTQDGRWSLPLDLMEPFRPAVIDALTLRLFSFRILRAEHFEPQNGGIYLNLSGRRLLHQHYEQRLQRPFYSEHLGLRTSIRQQLTHAPLHYKIALHNPDAYRPFRLN